MAFTETPLIRNALSDKERERFDGDVLQVVHAVEEGVIANPRYTEMKFTLGRTVEHAWDRYFETIRPSDLYERHQDDPDVQISYDLRLSNLHEVLISARKLDRNPSQSSFAVACRAFIDEVRPLAKAVADLKDKAVKRKVKTEEERQAEAVFVPPLPSEKAAFAVYQALKEVTERHFDRLLADVARAYRVALDAFLRGEQLRSHEEQRETPLIYPVTRLVKAGRGVQSWRFVAIPDADQHIATMALKDAQEMRDEFLSKNLAKIASILDKKGFNVLDQVVCLQERISFQGLQGSFKFTFHDGSAFTVKNAVVLSHSVHGTPFARWPITFHDVRLSGGNPMGSPSEERMHTVFAA